MGNPLSLCSSGGEAGLEEQIALSRSASPLSPLWGRYPQSKLLCISKYIYTSGGMGILHNEHSRTMRSYSELRKKIKKNSIPQLRRLGRSRAHGWLDTHGTNIAAGARSCGGAFGTPAALGLLGNK